jgi:hypothetical protein
LDDETEIIETFKDLYENDADLKNALGVIDADDSGALSVTTSVTDEESGKIDDLLDDGVTKLR